MYRSPKGPRKTVASRYDKQYRLAQLAAIHAIESATGHAGVDCDHLLRTGLPYPFSAIPIQVIVKASRSQWAGI